MTTGSVLGDQPIAFQTTRQQVRRRPSFGCVCIGLGVVLEFVGTMVMRDVTAGPRWVVCGIGLLLIGVGVDVVCKALWGQGFQTGLWFAGIWIALLGLLAVFADLLPLESPKALPVGSPGYTRPDLFSEHPLGTDVFGRDYLSRVIYGARASLFIGLGATAAGLIVGTTFGVIAGYYRGRAESVINVVTDSLLAFPPLVFLLALVVILRPRLGTLFVAFAVLTVPTIIRLARANTYLFAQREFVTAARASGATSVRVIVREIVPNIASTLLSFGMVIVASLIIAEASLSFLGLGIQQPDPSWGNMISDATNVVQKHPHTLLVPSIALFLTVMAFNRLGERARRASREAVL